MPNRPAIPAGIKREILLESGQRCAVCGTSNSLEIAHIIPWHKSKEYKMENLLCLCANCHTRADKENWGEKALKEHKKHPWVMRHHEKVDYTLKPTSMVELRIEMELPDFDEKNQRLLQYALAGFLDISPNAVRIISKKQGSVIITIEIPEDGAEKLLNAYEQNRSELIKHLDPLILLDLRRVKAGGESTDPTEPHLTSADQIYGRAYADPKHRAPSFTPEEQVLLNMSDEEVDALCIPAQTGNMAATQRLCAWALVSAHEYYFRRVSSSEDVAFLTSDFIEQFVRYFPTVQKTVSHWARRVMSHRLVRLKKRREKRQLRKPLQQDAYYAPKQDSPEVSSEYETIMQLVFEVYFDQLNQLDEQTRIIFSRLIRYDKSLGGPNPYTILAEETGKTKFALHMQFQRFLDKVINKLSQRMGIIDTEKRKQNLREVRNYLKEVLRKHDIKIDAFLHSQPQAEAKKDITHPLEEEKEEILKMVLPLLPIIVEKPDEEDIELFIAEQEGLDPLPLEPLSPAEREVIKLQLAYN